VDPREAEDLYDRYVYMDLPASPDDASADAIAATRFDIPAVINVVARYDALFGSPEESRLAEIAAALQSAMSDYMSLEDASALDPRGFNEFLRTSPDHGTAYAHALALRDILDGIRGLGLTRIEYLETRSRLMDPLVPPDFSVSPNEMGEAIERAERPSDPEVELSER
jgi:hypothetical protein